MPSITVSHNVEMGHRLSNQPDSKCFHIHGHSWQIHLTIYGPMDQENDWIMDFADVKKPFREWLDREWDHHLLLNPEDPLVQLLKDTFASVGTDTRGQLLNDWGITLCPEPRDPTVENVARWVHEWAKSQIVVPFGMSRAYKFQVEVCETGTNKAAYGDLAFMGERG